jgi:uncharacterized protein (DUF697 family)
MLILSLKLITVMEIIEKAKSKIKENVLQIEHRTDITNDEKSDLIIKLFSGTCAAVAIQPIPFADFFVLTPLQAYMGSRLAAIRGISVRESEVKVLLKEIASVIGLGLLAQQLAIGAYKTFIPFLGALTTIPIVYGLTYAIGKTMDAYLVNKSKDLSMTKKQMKTIFDEMLKKGKEEGKKNKDSIKHTAKKIKN